VRVRATAVVGVLCERPQRFPPPTASVLSAHTHRPLQRPLASIVRLASVYCPLYTVSGSCPRPSRAPLFCPALCCSAAPSRPRRRRQRKQIGSPSLARRGCQCQRQSQSQSQRQSQPVPASASQQRRSSARSAPGCCTRAPATTRAPGRTAARAVRASPVWVSPLSLRPACFRAADNPVLQPSRREPLSSAPPTPANLHPNPRPSALASASRVRSLRKSTSTTASVSVSLPLFLCCVAFGARPRLVAACFPCSPIAGWLAWSALASKSHPNHLRL